MELKQIICIAYGAYLFLLSVLTFFAYKIDKKKAQKGKWRTKEKTLLSMSFFGGAFGGYLAMQKYRHKTTMEHWYFTVINVLGILIHTAGIIYVVFFLEI